VTAMDIGSSTGGFTDVLLTHGAERVFAVDSAPINWRGNCARTRASPFWNRHRRAS
jgi:23S rRNA C2498 (ribose-2'-O)-methylase RlmM